MADDLDVVRKTVQASLPSQVQMALAGYERFTALAPPDDSKGFAAWHAAAKAALAHVELLVKLLRWAQGPGLADSAAGEAEEPSVERLLAQARAALGALDEEEEADLD